MAQYQFNVGRLFGVDANGNPQEVGLLQDVSLDISREIKELSGANAFAEVLALGKGKITGKASSAEFNSNNLNLMMGGLGTVTSGQYLMASEAVSLSSGVKSYTVANAVNYTKNLGVNDITNPLNSIPLAMSTNSTVATPAAPVVTVSSTGGSIPAGTYSVRVAALNQAGYSAALNNGIDQQLASLNTPNTGISLAATGVTTGAVTGSTNMIQATVAPVAGALAYAWYVGVAAAEKLQIITSVPVLNIISLVAGTAVVPVSDASGIFNPGNYAIDNSAIGKYNFNQTDAAMNKNMIVNYLWKDNTSGQTIQLNNKQMGVAQYFSLFLSSPLVNKQGITKQCNVWLNAVISNKVALGWKLGDFQKPQFDFQASSDAIGGLGWVSLGT